MMPLTLHEAVSGHHFQFARALELPEAPMFAKTELDIVNEIDRYIGDPAQALGYKIGQIKISQLRARPTRAGFQVRSA